MSSPRTTPTSPSSPRGIASADAVRLRLRAYRVMAYVAGISLLLLCTSLVLEYGFGQEWLSWVAIPHGWLYLVYLITVLLLGTAVGWSLGRMVLVAVAGTIPVMSFVAERKVTRGICEPAGTGAPAARGSPD